MSIFYQGFVSGIFIGIFVGIFIVGLLQAVRHNDLEGKKNDILDV